MGVAFGAFTSLVGLATGGGPVAVPQAPNWIPAIDSYHFIIMLNVIDTLFNYSIWFKNENLQKTEKPTPKKQTQAYVTPCNFTIKVIFVFLKKGFCWRNN